MSSPANTVPAEGEVQALIQELRAVSIFSDLPDEGLGWMASQMIVRAYATGEAAIHEGEPADRMVIVLSGEFLGRIENGPDDGRKYLVHSGEITGILPYSRMKIFPTTLRAVVPGRIGTVPITLFDELLQRVPQLHSRFVAILADRVRRAAVANQQVEKMAALGKLSAGVAHELNNPAAAAKRATRTLRETIQGFREANWRLDPRALTPEQCSFLLELERGWESGGGGASMDSLERGDREDELAAWMEDHNISDAWQLAADLVSAGCDIETLNKFAELFDEDLLEDVIKRASASLAMSRLLSEIESSTSRISELVRSIKEYSYMDRMPQQEIDLHDGIESTLVMLGHRLKGGISIARDYDRSIPRIMAYGSELNQVWTNLIDNAIDAMGGQGELRIRTSREFDHALVEVRDSGPGIPPEIRGRIFEPFFTTKPVGQGTGLGLDTVYRTVQKHGGEILVESQPGDTRFQVRLPFATASKEK